MTDNLRPSICIFCGSRPGLNTNFARAAEATGRMLARNEWRLVYGAGDVGLMGTVAVAAQMAGAKTLGVIPEHLLDMEVGKRDLDQFIVTQTMHERKKVMFMNSDAFVVLPGGAGTLDEFFEILTWAQLDLHAKPIFLLNTEGFWDPLSDLIEHVIREGFAAGSLRDLYSFVATVEELETALRHRLSRDTESKE